MNHPPQETDDVKGVGVYPTDSTTSNQPPTGASGTPSVRVYDRPDSPAGGINMMSIALMIIALLVVGAIVWSVMM
jgi:hypothetical protein